MTTWSQAIRYGVAGGAAASVVSTLLLLLLARRQTGHALAATNATSHWLWREAAFAQDGASLRYTLSGYVIHHCACTFWSVLAERYLANLSPVRRAGTTALAACVVDYGVCPKRLTPGYEARLSTLAVGLSYVACATGFALAAGDQ